MRKKYTAVYWRNGLMLEDEDKFEIYTTEEWKKNGLLIAGRYALNYQLFPLTITELTIKEFKQLDRRIKETKIEEEKIKKTWNL